MGGRREVGFVLGCVPVVVGVPVGHRLLLTLPPIKTCAPLKKKCSSSALWIALSASLVHADQSICVASSIGPPAVVVLVLSGGWLRCVCWMGSLLCSVCVRAGLEREEEGGEFSLLLPTIDSVCAFVSFLGPPPRIRGSHLRG